MPTLLKNMNPHKRRSMLCLLSFPLAVFAEPASSPPWRVIFNNDTTNILSCQSPYHHGPTATLYQDAPGEQFTDEMVRASVDEAAVQGMDAMALMPGCGRIPWWPSKIYPMAEHEAWFQAHYGVKPHFVINDYLMAGGDYIKVFVDECHKKGIAALISYRLNDGHLLEDADGHPKPIGTETIARYYVEHPEFRLERKSTGYGTGVENWLHPEIPALRLSLITELLENYDLQGVELDFLRVPRFFPEGTPMPEKMAVMGEFLKGVRAALDRTAKGGQRRYLGTRVDCNSDGWAATGFDPAAFRAAGVDYFNLSPSYNSTQQTSIAAVRSAVPSERLYFEETMSPQNWPLISGYDGTDFRRNAAEMLESTARLAYHRGVDGISLFNFAYYRPFGQAPEKRGPFDEPLFQTIPLLADPAALEHTPSYFYRAVNESQFHGSKGVADVGVQAGQQYSYSLDMVPLAGNPEGRLRLQVLTPDESRAGEGQPPIDADRGHWQVKLNGVVLSPASDPKAAYPFPTSIRAGFGHANQYLAWRVPAGLAIDGSNNVEITFLGGPSALRLRWIEVFSYPAAS
jgi:hypothetical protein